MKKIITTSIFVALLSISFNAIAEDASDTQNVIVSDSDGATTDTGMHKMTPEQRSAMKAKMAAMTPEQRSEMKARRSAMKAKMAAMTPEQRSEMKAKMTSIDGFVQSN